jgi:hypothetical protein
VEAIMPRKRGGGTDFLDALPTDGERRLMLAVLIDAIRALQHHRTSAPNLRMSRAWLRERAWLKSNDHLQPFSFVNICSALGLEAEYVRRCVLGPNSPRRHVNLRRYAARVEDSWLRQRKDGMGCGLSFNQGPAQAIALRVSEATH